MGIFNRKKPSKKDSDKIKKATVSKKADSVIKDLNIKDSTKSNYRSSAKSNSFIKWPIMSEKSLNLISDNNHYIFAVDKRATKPEIKKQIEKTYNVKVEKVRTSVQGGENRRFRGITTKAPIVKKAFVTIQKGQKIDISGNI